MDRGSFLIGVGLTVTLVALAFEVLSIPLSGLAVGAGLVVAGFVVLTVDAVREDRSPD